MDDQAPPTGQFRRRSSMTGSQASTGQFQRRGNMSGSNVAHEPPEQQQALQDVDMADANTEQQQPQQEPEGQFQRRGSMTEDEEVERRASIKAIMVDTSMSAMERRRSIQYLMDGRRNSANGGVGSTSTFVNPMESNFIDMARRMEQSRPKCNHYERNCTIVAPCCVAAFGCRICHDECPVLPPQKYGVKEQNKQPKRHPRSSSLPASWTEMPEPEHHQIDRFAIREIICRICHTRQSSKTNECIKCHIEFGKYHCDICNLVSLYFIIQT